MQKPLLRLTRTARPAALCLLAFLVLLTPFLWNPAAHAQDAVPGMDSNELNGGMDGKDEPEEQDSGGEESGTEESGTEESGEEDSEGGLVSGIAEDVFNTIMTHVVEKTGEAAAGWATDFLTEGAFSLPEPEGEIKTFYDQVSGVVQPGATDPL